MSEEEVLPKAANFLWLGNKNGKEKKLGGKKTSVPAVLT